MYFQIVNVEIVKYGAILINDGFLLCYILQYAACKTPHTARLHTLFDNYII